MLGLFAMLTLSPWIAIDGVVFGFSGLGARRDPNFECCVSTGRSSVRCAVRSSRGRRQHSEGPRSRCTSSSCTPVWLRQALRRSAREQRTPPPGFVPAQRIASVANLTDDSDG
ncbi:MAG: hypothetical protein DMG00_24975 [Acidobacteria bacterium]|nr:MAG: hypothetical protein DMG00_24975 [Acidobacteriota bacterium]